VTGQMWKNKGVKFGNTTGFFLCLNSKASAEITWHCKHYKGRGLMKEYKTLHDLARTIISLLRTSRLLSKSSTRMLRSKRRILRVAHMRPMEVERPGTSGEESFTTTGP